MTQSHEGPQAVKGASCEVAGHQQTGVQACMLWELCCAVTERRQHSRLRETQALTPSKQAADCVPHTEPDEGKVSGNDAAGKAQGVLHPHS